MHSFRKWWNAVVTIAIFPGILSHEIAHLLACYVFGVEVHHGPSFSVFTDSVSLDHEPVNSFLADFGIAVAPFVVNTALVVVALAGMKRVSGTSNAVVFLWLAVCFALTAAPSESDTRSLVTMVRTLPSGVRPVGYLVAGMIRALTIRSEIAGVWSTLWFVVLYSAV